MSNQTAEAKVADIIRDAQMPVTKTTLEWFEALYAAGALIYGPDGTVSLEPKVREVIAAMHQVLAGGDVRLEVVRQGDATYAKLEELFDRAVSESSTANELRDGEDEVMPYLP
ncbi:MAG: hypothetical protein M0R80_10475 [Proteobacteria bacterium]|nr:hypothetical protein [Pseudomonadota bacterium]